MESFNSSSTPAECFRISPEDNVATLLQDTTPTQRLLVHSAPELDALSAHEVIRAGHKIALRAIPARQPVIKYGFPIGETTQPIAPGEWVHLHNCRSLYDQQSSSLDINSGERTETPYV